METYVWGSNSSHQLTLGSQEKVLVAKLSTELSGHVQVSDTELHIISTWTFACDACLSNDIEANFIRHV